MISSMSAFWVVIRELLDIVHPASMAEIGADEGGLTQKLCEWAGVRDAQVCVIETEPKAGLKQILDAYPFASLYLGLSLEVLPSLRPLACYFIDGDHNYYTVSNELNLIAGRRSPDLILLHDVCWPWGRRDMYYNVNTIPPDHRNDPIIEPGYGILPGHPGIFANKGFHGGGRFIFARQEGGPHNGVRSAVEDFLIQRPDYQFFSVDCVFGLGVLVPRSSRFHAEVARVLDRYVSNPLISMLEEDRLQTFVKSY